MTIAIDPVIGVLGPFAIRWFGVLALLGLGAAVWLTLRRAQRAGVPRQPVLDALAWAIPAGVLGGRTVQVLAAWDYYLTRPAEVWQLQFGGLSLWGGLGGGGLVAAWALRSNPEQRARVADAAAPGLALGIAIGGVGAFLDGAGQGAPTGLPWGTRYASALASASDYDVLRHPAQAYDAIAALAILAALRLVPGRWAAGSQFWTFLALYGAARVLLGPVRADAPFLLGRPADELVAGLVAAFALAQGVRALRHARTRAGQAWPARETLAGFGGGVADLPRHQAK